MAARATNTTQGVVKPKVFIVSMFSYEQDVWYGIEEFNILANNITLPGASPLYPDVHCTADGDVCQITIGESGEYTIETCDLGQNAHSPVQKSMLQRP